MLRQAASVEHGSSLRTDACIVGAGPAGITLALELMQQGTGVVLLEAGGEIADWPSPELRGEAEGDPYPPLATTRRRGFGGTSLAWHLETKWSPNFDLRCHALNALDFETRADVPHTGWPFGLEELRPYYERAHGLMGLGDFDYRVHEVEGDETRRLLPFDQTRIEGVLFRFASRHTFWDLRPRLIDAPNVTVVLNAQASEVETVAGPHQVSRIRVGGARHHFWVEARVYVLACGGIENARLLLLSDRSQPGGLGNGNEVVGRYFMEHLTSHTGDIQPDTKDFWKRIQLYKRSLDAGVPKLAALGLSEERQRQEGLAGVIFSPIVGRRVFFQRSFQSLSSIMFHLRNRHRPPSSLWHLKNIARDPLPPVIACYLRFTNRINRRHDFFGLQAHFEQTPNPYNRVTLTANTDTLGLRLPKLAWRIGDLERHSLNRSLEILDEEIRTAGVGTLKGGPIEATSNIGVTHHHMGTTRMHTDPKHGVVDADCRVHGTGNLFIAGSSVMPTGGAATATLTLVALAIRLADRLKRELTTSEHVSIRNEPSTTPR